MRRGIFVAVFVALLLVAAPAGAYDRFGPYQTMGQLPRNWHTPYRLVGGVPLVNYGTFWARNPVTAAQYGLANYSIWTQDHAWIRWHAARVTADWLVRNQTRMGTWPYSFIYVPPGGGQTFAPGWLSALAQGQALSLLERVYHTTRDNRYLAAIAAGLYSLETPVQEGGLERTYDGGLYFEEYATVGPNLSLNGDLQTLIGLYDAASVAPEAGRLFHLGVDSLAGTLQLWDSGHGYSYYSLAQRAPAPPSYNELIRVELRILTSVSKQPSFARYANLWSAP